MAKNATAKRKPAAAAASQIPKEADEHGIVRRGVWPLDRIKEYPHNARTHPEAQLELLAGILKKYGPDQDIIVDEDEIILKGHGRKQAAGRAGMEGFPVTQRYGLTDAEKRAMRIQDNQVALLSGWDTQLIRFEIESLKRTGYDIDLLGFGQAQIVEFTTTPQPPSAFPTHDENIATAHQCPSCGYKWSGNSAPIEGKPDAPTPSKTAAAKKNK